MFGAALFKITKNWNQPRCPSIGKWLNKQWYRQITERHAATSVFQQERTTDTPTTWMTKTLC